VGCHITESEPHIVGFICNWCSNAGADFADTKIQYPSNIHVTYVACSGRVDPPLVLRLLAEGVDGVMFACCPYISQNLQARRRFALMIGLAEKTEFDLRRLRVEYVSPSEEQRFAQLVTEFIDQVKTLGPSPLSGNKPDPDLLLKLQAAKAVAEGFRMRMLVGKEEQLVSKGNVYGKLLKQEEFDKVIDEAVDSDYARQRIRLVLLREPMSAKDLSKRLRMDPREVLERVVAMRLSGWIDVQEVRGSSPIYRVLEVSR